MSIYDDHAESTYRNQRIVWDRVCALTGNATVTILRRAGFEGDALSGEVPIQYDETLFTGPVHKRYPTDEETASGLFTQGEQLVVFYDYELPDNEVILVIGGKRYIVTKYAYNQVSGRSEATVREEF